MKKIVHFGLILLFLSAQVAFGTEVSPTPAGKMVKNEKKVSFVRNILTKNFVAKALNKRMSVAPLQDEERLYTTNKITISAIYPNPASTYAAINYTLSNESTKAKVVLCNVLGNIVGEYSLQKDAKQLIITTQDMASGVYFYTLNVDGKNVINRRLIIKHN